MSNVIQFPGINRNPPVLQKEKIATDVSTVKFNHIHETLQILIPKLFNDISLAGFDVVPEEEDDSENIKDSAMIVESIRSLLCKYYDIKHPIQEISDSFFIEGEDGTITVTKHLDLNLEDYEEDQPYTAE
jgi:hypothetical protein